MIDQEIQKKFDNGIIEAIWSDNGELTYIIKDGLNLEEFASLAKEILEDSHDIAHDFSGKVINESNTASAKFDYKSGWFLDGIAEGEVE